MALDQYLNEQFLSTLSLRRATEENIQRAKNIIFISIHALLAESDIMFAGILPHDGNFYPRSPCGERLQKSCDRY